MDNLKLVHAIDASNWTPGELGVFYMALVCDPDKRQKALDETERYLRSLTAADFTEERIRKAVRQLMVSEINARKTVSGQASKLAAAEVVIGDIRYAEQYLKKAMRITAEDLVRVLREWLLEETMTVVSLNPKDLESEDVTASDSSGSNSDFETRSSLMAAPARSFGQQASQCPYKGRFKRRVLIRGQRQARFDVAFGNLTHQGYCKENGPGSCPGR